MSPYGTESHAHASDDVSLVDRFVLALLYPVLFGKPTLLEVKDHFLKPPGRGANCSQTKKDYTRWRIFGQIIFLCPLSQSEVLIRVYNESTNGSTYLSDRASPNITTRSIRSPLRITVIGTSSPGSWVKRELMKVCSSVMAISPM